VQVATCESLCFGYRIRGKAETLGWERSLEMQDLLEKGGGQGNMRRANRSRMGDKRSEVNGEQNSVMQTRMSEKECPPLEGTKTTKILRKSGKPIR